MCQSHRGIIWNTACVLIVPQPMLQRVYTNLLIQEKLVGRVRREGIPVQNKSSATWVPALWLLPAPGPYLGSLGYAGCITPSWVRRVLMQITY